MTTDFTREFHSEAPRIREGVWRPPVVRVREYVYQRSMSDFAGIILRAIVGIANGIIGVVQLLHWGDRRISNGSVAGESRIDKESRDWRERLFLRWQWAAVALLVLAALAGGGYWLLSL